MKLKKREFRIDEKETFTLEEVKSILGQHDKFINDGIAKTHVTLEEHQKTKDELKPFLTDKRNSHISSLIKDKVNEKYLNDAIKLADISEDDDDATIVSKIEKAREGRDYLNTPVLDDDAAKKETINKNVVPIQTVQKQETQIGATPAWAKKNK